jgi:tRNA nucleotidyltransferase (CCA-adding enzyme)
MPDYIYLLENRLSAAQQNALRTVRDLAREAQMTVFLTGDAVRDLTCGNSVRELEMVVHGNAHQLKKATVAAGAAVWGEDSASRTLYLCFPGNVRVDLSSARRVEYPKPGKPVYHWASIQDDLRSRDFTVNAMAVSLNEGSYGLLMDPTNGVADIEARLLRLVSNYGFLENPVNLIRVTRLKARLSFELEERTQTRYENAKGEEVIEHLTDLERGRELEQIAHEDDPLKVMHALEAEGWMHHLFIGWTAAKADADKLTALHTLAVELQVQGVMPDLSAAQMQLLTAKVAAKELAHLKKLLLRPGFVQEWESLDARAAEFAKILLSKENAAPSATYNLFMSYPAEAVLWLGFTGKQAAVKEKFENFLKVWPQARQKIPYALMQEMRITPELPGYQDLVKAIFLQLIDGGLTTPEEMRAMLEPHSPPAPPPPVTIKRTRAKKGADAKARARMDDDEDSDSDDEEDEDSDDSGDLDSLDLGGDDINLSIGGESGEEEGEFAGVATDDSDDDEEDEDGDDEPDDEPPARRGRSAGRKKATARAESRGDSSTAYGAGLKALALKLDLEEPTDPADLDEADPTVEVGDAEDGDEPPPRPKKGAKPAPAKKTAVKSAPAKSTAAKPVQAKTPAKAAAKSAPAKSKPAPAPVKKVPVKAVAAKAVAAKATPAKAASTKAVPAKSSPAKAAPVKRAPVKSAPAKTAPKKAAPVKAAPAKAAPKKAAAKPAAKAPAKAAKKRR